MKKRNTLLTILFLFTLLTISSLLNRYTYAYPININSCTNKYYSNTTYYYNGNIITMDDNNPFVEGVLTRNGKIMGTGNIFSLFEYLTPYTKFINLNGNTMLPGFVDAHSHISTVGQYDSYSADMGITSIDEFIKIGQDNFKTWYSNSVNNGTYENGDWYVGNGYDNTQLPNEKHPTADDLDKISEEVPICIIHTSGHMAVVNHKGLEILNYTKDSPMLNQLKKYIKLDNNGNPTGLIQENAFFRLYLNPNILYDATKTNTKDNVTRLKDACNTYASYGITTAQDGSGSTLPSTIKTINENGDTPLIDLIHYDEIKNIPAPSKYSKFQNRYKVGGVKIILDGSPQGKTAWLKDPYYVIPEGKPADYCGYPSKTDEEVYNTLVSCLKHGYQVLAHTNGSAAIEQFITQFEKAKNDTGITTDIRPVLIHAQTITENQLNRCSQLGINTSFFCDHVYYWGDYYLSSILGPEKGNKISPIASALRRNINVTMHQDSPIVPPNMLFSIHNAVNRRTRNGVLLGGENRISVMDAIKLVTINSAYQSFEENTRGSITKGKIADFVILDKNPLTVDKSTIKDIKILKTIKNDKVVYSYN